MKQLILAVFAMLMLASCSSDEPAAKGGKAQPINLSRSEQEIVTAQRAFAVDFFKKVYASEITGRNIIVSPLSMTFGFSMVANGAEGETLDELASLLGFDSEGIEAMNSLNRTLLGELPDIDPKTKIAIANSLWTNDGIKANPIFSQTIRSIYDAEVANTDLYSMKGSDEINGWIKNKTAGMIPQLLSEPLCSDFALCNTLYFEGKWRKAFKPEKTAKAKFHNADGSESEVDMMELSELLSIYFEYEEGLMESELINQKTIAVRKYYGNGAYSMTLVRPGNDVNMKDFISSLDISDVELWEKELHGFDIRLYLPRFECEYGKSDFRSELNALGIKKVFSSDAELTGILENNVMLGKVIHRAKIKVDESGTIAAATTVQPGASTASMPLTAKFDRPFMYYISEQSTGAILFMGCVNAF